jgi:hypothetical protein
MLRKPSRAFLVLTLILPALNGCLWHTRKVPLAVMPVNVLSATPQQLVDIVNRQYQAIHSLSATVEFTATEGGSLKGRERTITPFSGYIRLQKPGSLRVIGFLPVVHTRAFDMASDGQTFKLWIPPKNEVVEGANTVTKKSKNAFENLRPYVFFDSLLIRSIGPDEELLPTAGSRTVLNPKTRKLEIEPEYLLTVLSRLPNSNILHAKRVIYFSRIDLRPIEEDIYDDSGQIQTQAIYGPLQTYGTVRFPGSVTIRRPLEQYQILITIQKLQLNLPLDKETFELSVPKDVPVRHL